MTSAARLVTLSRKHDHISPVLMELHWLPVEQCVEFMVLLFTCKVVSTIKKGQPIIFLFREDACPTSSLSVWDKSRERKPFTVQPKKLP